MTEKSQTLRCISGVMKDMGIPASIRGYKFLCQAILLALDNENVLYAVTKVIYPTVAKDNETTPSRVERSMRHAIETAWERGDVRVLSELFGYTVKASRGKPTNSEFIAIVTEHIKLNLTE